MSNDNTDERLVRIETKLDMLLTRDDDKEDRIRALEQANWKMVGGCFVLSAVVSALTKYLLK